ncbi:hypothetical protein BAUCODRAFT_119031 [Baudoinia panamericana UAMH 10762]|uniref:HECT-type E3 ubiquitin transferase n=1 Tax=Baudoinia panamericana (strain UAMH 10762) TaxID=717646 RepID=M2LXN0_BAUPA|nr:uncharacterized protein BAUCODRAFT_119031 [Baudoinia panamericana UAMH 10762]EMC99447.1 hypothetical protein BAUCODRAFT_119031 [Baudoinia panamericana UAMH 10762]
MATASSRDISNIQHLLSQYVTQLVDGCGSPSCRESQCHTGRRNLTPAHQPIRKYTVRSARAIALALVGGPHSQTHLCQYCTRSRLDTNAEVQSKTNERRYDTGSFTQLISQTPSVRKSCSRTNHFDIPAGDNDLEHYLSTLQPLLDHVDPNTSHPNIRSASDASRRISACILKCLADVPIDITASGGAVHACIAYGYAYPPPGAPVPGAFANPSDPKISRFLDYLHHGPANALLAAALKALAMRVHLEEKLAFLDHPLYVNESEHSTLNSEQPPRDVRGTLDMLIWTLSHTLDTERSPTLMMWTKKLFLSHWDGSSLIRRDTTAYGALVWMQRCSLETCCEESVRLCTLATALDEVHVAETWLHRPRTASEAQHLLSFPAVFDVTERLGYFRTINHLRMRKAHSLAVKAVMLRRQFVSDVDDGELGDQLEHKETPYLLLQVSRTNILQDTFDQLWQRRASELKRPLRVRLGEVDALDIGQDLGGVQIEFFNLLCRELFAEAAQIFTTNVATGLSYFRPGSLQPLYMFETVGLLLALAIYNGITIPVSFPRAFYNILINGQSSNIPLAPRNHIRLASRSNPMDAIKDGIDDGWPQEHSSLIYILQQQDTDLGLEWSFPMEANGYRLYVTRLQGDRLDHDDEVVGVDHSGPTDGAREVHGGVETLDWPGWRFADAPSRPVGRDQLGDYVNTYAWWLAYGCVRPQWQAFMRGFYRGIDREDLALFTPAELKSVVEGSTHLDIDELRRAARHEGFDDDLTYIDTFWDIASRWPEETQKHLLKFVTAAERVPVGGASSITFIVRPGVAEDPEALPTSSTCFGTLTLPIYPSAEVLERKLLLAIEYGMEGFGTG